MTKTFNELIMEVVDNFGKVIHYNRHNIMAMSDDGNTLYSFEYDVKYNEGSVLPYYYITTGKKYVHDKKAILMECGEVEQWKSIWLG